MENSIAAENANLNLLQSKEYLSAEGELIVPIGIAADNSVFVQDFAKIPHILICGFSGSGKTSFVQTVISSISSKYTCDEAKFLIFDSKMVDYSVFNSLPLLHMPVTSDDQKLLGGLLWAASECQKRYHIFSEAGTKDIFSYNEKCKNSHGTRLPHIFVIMDDFSSLSLYRITDPLTDVLKNGRVVGIHVVIVTSMTSAKFLPKDLLSNLPCRVSFCVSSKADSRIAIDQNGAENLNVPGEMIFRWQNNFSKCQAAYMPYEDMQRIVQSLYLKERKKISTLGDMAANIFSEESSQNSLEKSVGTTDGIPEYDPLISYAAAEAITMGSLSTSLLQRRLKLGYSRAARIVDQLEELGVVGPYDGAKPRFVLMKTSDWNAVCEKYGFDKVDLSVTDVGHSKTSDTKNSGAPHFDKSSPQGSGKVQTEAADSEDSEPPDIPMRDFELFWVGASSLCVRNNLIQLRRPIKASGGSGTTSLSFNGKTVAALVYKKPGIFSNGYIQFELKSKVNLDNRSPHILNVTKNNLANLLKIEFGKSDIKRILAFITQISEDINISLTEI